MPQTGTGRNKPILRPRYKPTFPEKKKHYSGFITAKMIIRKLNEEGCPIYYDAFYKLMLEKNLFMMTRQGKRWVATPSEARLIVELIKEWYGKESLFDDLDRV